MIKKKLVFAFMFAFMLGLSACGTQGGAGVEEFQNTEYEARWASLPVKISVQTDYQREAIDFYNDLFPGVVFFEESDAEDAVQVGHYFFEEDDEVDGFTSVDFDRDGFINSGEILIGDKFYESSISRKLMTHELMHLLGYGRHDDSGLMKRNFHPFKPMDELFGEGLRQWLVDTYELDVD